MVVLQLSDFPVRVLGDREEVTHARGVDPLAVLDIALDRGEVQGALLDLDRSVLLDLLHPVAGGDADLVLGRDRLEDAGVLAHLVLLLGRGRVRGFGANTTRKLGHGGWVDFFGDCDGPDSAGTALAQLGDLISVMRLFKPGGVGLGPHAFVPGGEAGWRRLPTGAPAPRQGGYTLDQAEAEQLVELAETLEARPDPAGPLAWAVRRFELGCERPSSLEGLSDHLLALRAVLDGQGPVGASLPMRAAALIAG